MDKKSLMAIGLISVVVMAWMFYTSTNTQHPTVEDQKKNRVDSTEMVEQTEAESGTESATESNGEGKELTSETATTIETRDSLRRIENYGEIFAKYTDSYTEIVTIETELYTAKLTRKGGALLEFKLKNYTQWNGYQSQFIWSTDAQRKGELYLTFVTKDAKKIDSRDLYFDFIDIDKHHIKISGDKSYTVKAKLDLGGGQSIEKSYKFYGNEYIFDAEITLNDMEDILPSRGYNYVWSDGLKYQERNTVDESTEAQAMVSLNGEILDVDATDDEPIEETATGLVDFAGIKTKYFGVGIIPENFDGTVDVYGFKQNVKKEGIVERYDLSFRVPYDGGKDIKKFRVFIGPLDYDTVHQYGLTKMIYFGWWIISYIGEYLILPLFLLLHGFIPNWGITIIVFSILMKFLLYPLSIQQMRTSQKMKLLGPEMEKVREEYKDDQQKQQKAMMSLYSNYGINPAGGCLPLLLQMPILFALWSVLRTNIDLRQADFIWWITDLSLPDVLVTLPFSLLGIKFISGLALLMGITMFLQQKLTITDPRQKAMVYMMPVMFTLIFSNLPSGLNLYYFMFNLIGIIQQVYINKFSKNQPTLADLKKAPKKEGWLQKKMKEAQDVAESRGKKIPGKTQNAPNPNRRKKKKK